MAQKVGQMFEKHVVKRIQQIESIPTGCIPIGLTDEFPCPKCNVQLNICGRGVNAAMYFTCPQETCNAQMVRWQKDEDVQTCPGCNVDFFTFRSWNDYVRKSHCRKCGLVYCGACLEEVVIPGYGKKIMDKYYMKQKACKPCRDEAATMRDEAEQEKEAPPKPDQSEIDAAADEAAADPSSFTAPAEEPPEEPPNLGGVNFEEPPQRKESSKAKPTGRANLFDDDDDDIFAEKKAPAKKNLGLFDDED